VSSLPGVLPVSPSMSRRSRCSMRGDGLGDGVAPSCLLSLSPVFPPPLLPGLWRCVALVPVARPRALASCLKSERFHRAWHAATLCEWRRGLRLVSGLCQIAPRPPTIRGGFPALQ
jgi:hypothetical protein